MKNLYLLFILVFLANSSFAQEVEINNFNQDTIWLKSGLVLSCRIDSDDIYSDLNVSFINHSGDTIRTRFDKKLIKKAHKLSSVLIADSTRYRIELKDGTTFIGVIINESEKELELDLKDIGLLTIQRDLVKKITPIGSNGRVGKAYWFENPHSTRLLFAPTAIPLHKGEAYYQNIYIVGNMFNYGIIDNLSVGGGFDLITMFTQASGSWNPMLNFNIKSGFKVSENLHLGIGGMYIGMANEFASGILYGIGTYGSYNTNATLGLGWGFVNGDFQQKPFIMIGGMARVSEKLWLISENWIVPVDGQNYYAIISYGMRFAAKRIAVDLAFINNSEIVEVIPIGFPFVDFVIKLGKY